MANLDPIPTTKAEDTKPKTIKGRIAAFAGLVTAVALFIGNVEKISSTMSGWIYGQEGKEQTVVIQITSESLLEAAHQLTEAAGSSTGPKKGEAVQAAQNLNAAAGKLERPISLSGIPEQSPPWLLMAMKELGQQEVPGKQSNQRILEYIRSAGSSFWETRGDEVPWTSFFVNWTFMQSGIDGTNNGRARSWLDWGVPLDQPKPGAVAVFRRRAGDDGTGVVGLYIGDAGDYVLCIGGNVADAVRISAFPKSLLLGYRWPKDV